MNLPFFTSESEFGSVVDNDLKPLLDKVSEICTSKGIPLVVAIQQSEYIHCRYLTMPLGASELMMALAVMICPEAYEEASPAN